MTHNVKLPEFMDEAKIQQWLDLVDLTFKACEPVPTAQRQYADLVRHLPSRILSDVGDITSRHHNAVLPNWTDQLKEFREALCHRNAESDRKALSRLLAQQDRGNLLPSQFLRQLRGLTAGRAIDNDAVIRAKWLETLPSNVQSCLVMKETEQLETLAQYADKMIEVLPAAPTFSVTQSAPFASASAPIHASVAVEAIQKIDRTLQDVVRRLERLEQQQQQQTDQSERQPRYNLRQNRSRSRDTSESRQYRGRSPTPTPNDGTCYYHHRFGQEATKCRHPCVWKDRTIASQPAQGRTSAPNSAELNAVLQQLIQMGITANNASANSTSTSAAPNSGNC
jgi:hypothetical protein